MNNLPHSWPRLRRYRQSKNIRELFQDIRIHPSDLILPIFVTEDGMSTEITSMPYLHRYSSKTILTEIERLLSLNIQCIALFPVIPASSKTLDCQEAWNPEGLIPRIIRLIKEYYPEMIVIADIALDPFHAEGQDGLIGEDGLVDNDRTISALVQQSIAYASAGADILGPSDMMDQRIYAIRSALEKNGFIKTLIMSYCVKFCSSLYGPFRDAVDSKRFLGHRDKKSYQMDYYSSFQIEKEASLDVSEGADILLVKPGATYLDIIHRVSKLNMPTWSYHVSGECSMLWYGAEAGLFKFEDALLETLCAQKRAGASKIITYFAAHAAQVL